MSRSYFSQLLNSALEPRTTALLLNIAKGAAVIHVFSTHAVEISHTTGISMVPTIAMDGEYIVLNKQCRRGKDVRVGDVICFKNPYVMDIGAIKRVVGMPGDFVLRDTPGRGNGDMIQVPYGHCWVAGDNQQWSRDSRTYGPIPLALIRGRVEAAFWPNPRRITNNLSHCLPDSD